MNSMIDHSSASRFSTGVPVSAIRDAGGMPRTAWACRVRGVLDVLRLVADHPAPSRSRLSASRSLAASA